jgi:hypothetical protein
VIPWLGFATVARAQSTAVEVLAITGQPAPDGNGMVLGFEGLSPTINDRSDVAVFVTYQGTLGGAADDTALLLAARDGSITQVAREDRFIPIGVGQYAGFAGAGEPPLLNNAGQLAFAARLRNSVLGDTLIYRREPDGTFRVVARDETTAVPGGGTFTGFFNLLLSESGQISFSAFGQSGGSFFTGIYRFSSDGLVELVRDGEFIAGQPVTGLSVVSETGLNDFGFVTQRADLNSPLAGDEVIIGGHSRPMFVIVREGDPAPGPGGGELDQIRGATTNNAVQVHFTAQLRNTLGGTIDDEALLLSNLSGNLTVVARENMPVPGLAGERFGGFLRTNLNEAGQVSFPANLRSNSGGPITGGALFRRDPDGTYHVIVRDGTPGPAGNGEFHVNVFTEPLMTQGGQILFESTIENTPGTEDQPGVFLADPSQIIAIIHEGDLIDGSPIVDLGDRPTGIQDRDLSNMNVHGQTAFRVTLADGRQALVRVTPDLYWRTDGNGNWDDNENWTVGLRPAEVHRVIIAGGGIDGRTVMGPPADTTVRSLSISGGESGSNRLETNGGDIFVLEDLRVSNSNGLTVAGGGNVVVRGNATLSAIGTVTQAAGAALIVSDNLNPADVGDGLFIDGTLTAELTLAGVSEISQFSTTSASIGAKGGGRSGMVTLSGGAVTRWTNHGPMQLGRADGTSAGGTLAVTDGASVRTAGLNVALDGLVEIDDGTMTIGDGPEATAPSTVRINQNAVVDLTEQGRISVGESPPGLPPDGELRVNEEALLILDGGTFRGRRANIRGALVGSGRFAATLDNNGLISPGLSIGLIDVTSNYIQDNPVNQLVIELGGTDSSQYDRLMIAGTALLNGILDVSFVGGFIPMPDDKFEILSAAGGITGTFASESLPTLSGGLFLDVFYLSNSVTLAVTGILGDYNHNGIVDAVDYVVWRKSLGQMGSGLAADGNGNNEIDAGDYDVWRMNFGRTSTSGAAGSANAAVPESSSIVSLLIAIPILLRQRQRRIGAPTLAKWL